MKIILDGNEVPELVPASLPMLIHGKEGSGASLYTIALAAKWFSQGYEILFLCGYPVAQEEFEKITGTKSDKAKFFTQDRATEFMSELKSQHDKRIVFIKNMELFDQPVYDAVQAAENLIISGDVSKSSMKEEMLQQEFITRVYFSSLPGAELSGLNKYEGLVTSGDYKGITKLSPQ